MFSSLLPELQDRILQWCHVADVVNLACTSSYYHNMLLEFLFHTVRVPHPMLYEKKFCNERIIDNLKYTTVLQICNSPLSRSKKDNDYMLKNFIANYGVLLKACNVYRLSLCGSFIPQKVFEQMRGQDHLMELDLYQTNTEDGNVALICKNFLSLKLLDLGLTDIRDSSLQHIGQLRQLTKLGLASCLISDQGLSYLVDMKLVKLNLSGCREVTDKGVAHVCEIVTLQNLNVFQCSRLTDEGVGYMTKLSALLKLNVGNCRSLSDEAVRHISEMRSLRDLSLMTCIKLTDNGVTNLKEVSSLERLNLSNCSAITDESVAVIGSLTTLKDLELSSCDKLTDKSLFHISNLLHLKKLSLSGCRNITDEGVAALFDLKVLKEVDFNKCHNLTEAALVPLRKLKKLNYKAF